MTRIALLLAAALLLNQCTVAPKPGDKPVTHALAAPKTGIMADTSARLAAKRSAGESSFLLLEGNKEALDWRLAMMDEACSSIDIQLYLWHKGSSSRLLFDRALRAADRGVRVRMLVDDFLFSTDEKYISAICRHQPNLDIRIFNPTRMRGNFFGSVTEFLLNFGELNRRMHNKTWTVDRTFSIVGGRNVADQYFGLSEKYNFVDFDVLVEGPVVADISDGFDLFWNSSLAYPGALLSRRGGPEHVGELKGLLDEKLAEESEGRLSSFPTRRRDWSREFARLPDQMATGRAQFLQDHPEPDQDERYLVKGISDMTRSQKGEVILITPYLIPDEGSIKRLAAAVESGIEVGVLVPSLGANNQPAAYSHYRKKRKPIIEAGGHLFEMSNEGTEALRALVDVHPVRSKEVALHAKAVVGDRQRCFIGSLNHDPRALEINTESGILIDSPRISDDLMALVERIAEKDSWQVTQDEEGALLWKRPGAERNSPPPARFSKKFISFIVGWLPIESQL